LLRASRRKSQRQLAEVAGVHCTYLGASSAENTPAGLLVYRRIAIALDVPLPLLVSERVDREWLNPLADQAEGLPS
jgi:transcriptional regulator with XRE-family HTH domain